MEFIKRLKQLLPVTSRSFQERMALLEQEMQAGMVLASQQRAAAADMHWVVNETKAQSDFEKHAARYVNPEITALQAFPASEGRILVAGWYGAENLGDELMMRTVIEHIPAHRLSDTWVLLWDNFEYPRMSLDPRVHVIHYPRSLWELQWYADAFDVLVWGGGAIIDDEQFSNDPFNINTGNLFIHLSSMMLAREKRVLCLGLSTSERLADPQFTRKLEAVIAGCDAFTLRDPLSVETLERCGIGVERVESCQDLVYANRGLRQLRTARMGGAKSHLKGTGEAATVPSRSPSLRSASNPCANTIFRSLQTYAEPMPTTASSWCPLATCAARTIAITGRSWINSRRAVHRRPASISWNTKKIYQSWRSRAAISTSRINIIPLLSPTSWASRGSPCAPRATHTIRTRCAIWL